MSRQIDKLQINDQVFIHSNNGISLTKIVRETKTQWITANDRKFRKEDNQVVGKDTWSWSYLTLATEEQIEKFNQKVYINNTIYNIHNKIDLRKLLSYEDCLQINEIISNAQKRLDNQQQ